MRIKLLKVQAVEILGLFFPSQTLTVNQDGVMWLDLSGTLGWLAWMASEFLDEGEKAPSIALSTGAELCYARVGPRNGWSFRYWLEGTESQILATLERMASANSEETPDTLRTAA